MYNNSHPEHVDVPGCSPSVEPFGQTTFTDIEQKSHQEIRYPNVTSLYFATRLVFNAPAERFPQDDLRKVLHGG